MNSYIFVETLDINSFVIIFFMLKNVLCTENVGVQVDLADKLIRKFLAQNFWLYLLYKSTAKIQ